MIHLRGSPERLPNDIESAPTGRFASPKKGKSKKPVKVTDKDALLGAGVFVPDSEE